MKIKTYYCIADNMPAFEYMPMDLITIDKLCQFHDLETMKELISNAVAELDYSLAMVDYEAPKRTDMVRFKEYLQDTYVMLVYSKT